MVKGKKKKIHTRLKPSTSASSTHFSMMSAIWEGVPYAEVPRPPTVMCCPTVFLVHLGTSGVAFDHPSTADLLKKITVSSLKDGGYVMTVKLT